MGPCHGSVGSTVGAQFARWIPETKTSPWKKYCFAALSRTFVSHWTLPVRKVSVGGQEDVEVDCSQRQQLAIFLLAHPISGAVLASCSGSSRFKRLGRHSSSRTRMGEERLLNLLQGRYGLLPGDGREVLQELGQRLPCLEVIEQRRERHAEHNPSNLIRNFGLPPEALAERDGSPPSRVALRWATSAGIMRGGWRRRPDLNRAWRFCRQGLDVHLVDSSCFLVGPTPPFSRVFGRNCSQIVPKFIDFVRRRTDRAIISRCTDLWLMRIEDRAGRYSICT